MAQSTQADVAEIRHAVALANRVTHAVGLSTAFGHVSGRIPGTDRFVFPTRASPGLARADRLLVLDTDGNVLEGEGTPNTEFWIHARIYAARPDVNGVAHVHSPACVIVSQIADTARILHNSAGVFADGVPVLDRVGLIRSRELGELVATTLGPTARAMLLRGHGANTVGPNVQRATVYACLLEEGADFQVRALAAVGGDASRVRFYDEGEAQRLNDELQGSGPMDRAWEYYAALAEGRV
jgi:ribulose-5-phosphate 4-epimerase/fuculose-1-phosphate aldolase